MGDSKWKVEVTFSTIPESKYEDFLEHVESVAREWDVDIDVGIGEEL